MVALGPDAISYGSRKLPLAQLTESCDITEPDLIVY